MNLTPQQIVSVIRNDKNVGSGTCSTLDECFDDAELVAKFGHLDSELAVIRAAYEHEDRQIGRMLDQRFGSDDDAELAIAKDWKARTKDRP